MNHRRPLHTLPFLFNSFTPTNSSSSLFLYGSAAVESRVLTLTNSTTFTIGRALYPQRIRTKTPNSSYVNPFSTSFIFAMAPYRNTLPGHGLVFLFVPFAGIEGASSSQNLGFLNRTIDNDPSTRIFGVEFDVFANQEFSDINDNHVECELEEGCGRDSASAVRPQIRPLVQLGGTWRLEVSPADSCRRR
ncbi:unnamed protein product [Linum tenue]|uniref:Legume lectin domain-containing protein n=1 Tax=Linum tenue TaxID=586396 RepID=A0AAV0H9Y0_9ROSI|nr:unnamed protein product [Linum tenue]CAI0448481.1 unnamed protein product [Linum tenue]CAI0453701.1 unnamed protein product [Linum tenue]CAI0455785.1 unnamed protein product [Linum tenue]CAI0545964.1 unnamed protein product [Linum tenue]